jgi:hypothetical protein
MTQSLSELRDLLAGITNEAYSKELIHADAVETGGI